MASLDNKFHNTVVLLARKIREKLQQHDELSRFCFRVEVEGRVHDGDMELVYKIGSFGGEVEAHSIDAVLDEWMRRKGFEKRNAPLCLPNVEQELLPPTLEENN